MAGLRVGSVGCISLGSSLISTYRKLLLPTLIVGFSNNESIRWASKKTGGSTRNQKGHGRPKHRGWRVQDGHYVQAGTILATQLSLRFHPGLNVILSSILIRYVISYSQLNSR